MDLQFMDTEAWEDFKQTSALDKQTITVRCKSKLLRPANLNLRAAAMHKFDYENHRFSISLISYGQF